MGTHIPYGIAKCYLPPGRGDILAFTPAEDGTGFSDTGGMQGWVDPCSWLERWFTCIMVTHHYSARLRLEPATCRSRVRRSTATPWCHLSWRVVTVQESVRYRESISEYQQFIYKVVCTREIGSWYGTLIAWLGRIESQMVDLNVL